MSVRKMAIVPFQLLEELKRFKVEQSQKPRLPPNPLVTDVAHHRNDMSTILENSDLSESEKAQRYGETLFKLQNSLQKAKTPSTLNLSNDTPWTDKTPSDTFHDRILQSVPKTMQRKAKLLLNMLKDNENLAWNNQGVVTYKGAQIPGSNIIDLINDSLRQRKGVEPKGWETFSKAMRESNIPQEVIGNPSRWKWMQKHELNDGKKDDNDSDSEISFRTPLAPKQQSTPKRSTSHKSPSKISQLRKISPYATPAAKERLKQFYTKELMTPPTTIKKRDTSSKLQKWEPY